MDNNKNFQQLEIPVLKKLYELYKYAHKSVSVFPKHERYSLGEKIETNILEAMELIIAGNSQPKNFKDSYLIKANNKVEILKILFRLSLDNKFIGQEQYIKTEEYLQESGRMLGGWIKYLRSDFVKYADKDEKKIMPSLIAIDHGKLFARRKNCSFSFCESNPLPKRFYQRCCLFDWKSFWANRRNRPY